MSESLSPSSDLTAGEAPALDPVVPGIPGARATFWTDERVARLKELQAQNYSGRRIGAELGITRNAAMGKLARMGLKCESMYQPPRGEGRKRERERKAHPWTPLPQPEGPKPAGQFRLTPTKKTLEPKPIKLVASAPEPIPATACSIYDLTNETCRWPCGGMNDPVTLFCGAPGADLAAGMPYCGFHAPRAYAPARWRP